MADKISNTYHSAMGATKETIGKIVHNEHLMNSGKHHVLSHILCFGRRQKRSDIIIFFFLAGRAERAQASAKSGKHIAEDANPVQTSQTETTAVETPANTQSAGHPLQDDNRRPAQDENRRASNEHLAFM